MGTQHSGLREDSNKIRSFFNYLLSHAPTPGRAIVRYRVWGGSRETYPTSFTSFPYLPFSLPYSHCPLPSTCLEFWSLAVVGTQHSGLREDSNKIRSFFNYLLSHAPTPGRAIVRYRVWGGSRVSAAPNNRARLTLQSQSTLPPLHVVIDWHP